MNRAKVAVYQAFEQLEKAGILVPITESARNQSWEVADRQLTLALPQTPTYDIHDGWPPGMRPIGRR